MFQNFADSMKMDEDTFAVYAAQIEQDDFECLLYKLCNTLKQLVNAREDTIEKLMISADYLDSLWLRCKVSRTLGTSVSVVGGSLTIAGGIHDCWCCCSCPDSWYCHL